ncbi:hypothetical protein CBI38_19865 [Rhodococcus oxybenzonivorans]|uniref:Uncharacterized protein n=1 Tax=Rhodococcus oxybenzonivorans TaxID=1990687 RepID=A0A2S2BXX2_9NOCA|nr:hypothetical protein CBI38_19865 [Rhodococcus oxybenzonivorans]
MSERAAQLRARRAQMRAELALFRRRLEEQRVRDEAEATRRRQCAGRHPAHASTATDAVAPGRSAAEDDDEFYRPRSWLVE